MNFSVNQVKQLYVMKALTGGSPAGTTHVISTDTVGTLSVQSDGTHMYFEYMGAGGQTRSDLIKIDHILWANAVSADDLARPLSRYKLTLDSNINSGNPVAGQDYILRIAFRNWIGLSEEDQYFKYGMAHAYSGMSASDFYKKLALSLQKNFSRETSTVLRFYLETGGTDPAEVNGTPTLITPTTKESDLTGTYTGLVIEEAPQEWILGVFEQVPVTFTLQPTTVVYDGDEMIWGVVNKVESVNKIEDGHKIADLEYFAMGERGDMYRNIGWPNVIRTQYLVNPDAKYNVLTIHYAFTDSNEGVQKSEKDILIVVEQTGGTVAGNALINSLITKVNAVAGTDIDELETT